MGQHLGSNEKANAPRRNLKKAKVEPESCDQFELIAYGPIFPEEQEWIGHQESRDVVAALEKKLTDDLGARHCVISTANSNIELDSQLREQVRQRILA